MLNKYDWKYIFKRVLIFFIILCILSFFKIWNANAAVNYNNSVTIDNPNTNLPNFTSSNDLYLSTINFSSGTGSNTYSFTFGKEFSGIDEFRFNLGINYLGVEGSLNAKVDELSCGQQTSVNYCVVNQYRINNWDLAPTVILIGRNSKHMVCTGYYTNDNVISYVCPADFSETYYGLSFKFLYSSNNMMSPASSYPIQLSIPKFMSIYLGSHTDIGEVIQNSSTQIITQQQATAEKVDNVDDTIKDSNTSQSETQLDGIVNSSDFDDSTGIDSIIKLPLNFINTIGNTCQPFTLTIPYLDFDITLPCFSSVLRSKVPTIASLLTVVINGFILYRCLLELVELIRSARNPDEDRIEVLDL